MARRRRCGGVRGEERRRGGGDAVACGERRGGEAEKTRAEAKEMRGA
jgi:hypothetical protein